MKCGHCGTLVEDGYTVCPACGANYRGHTGRKIVGFLFVAFGLFFLKVSFDIGAKLSELTILILLSAFIIFLGGAIFKWGCKKKWYRINN